MEQNTYKKSNKNNFSQNNSYGKNNKYQKNDFNKDNLNKDNTFNKNDNPYQKNKSFNKGYSPYSQDRDSIYEAKQYPKKHKVHNTIFDIPMTEYEMEKEYQRKKREMDKKRPKNKKDLATTPRTRNYTLAPCK